VYGFHKVNDLIHSNLTNENQTWEFKHPNFRKGAVSDLQHIKRKSAKTQQLQLQQNLQQQQQQQQQQLQQQQQQELQQQQQYNFNATNSNINNSNNISSNHDSANYYTQFRTEDASDIYNNNNPVIKHILRIEEQLVGVTKSCDQLFNEVVHLRKVVSKQQDVSTLGAKDKAL
jgi:type II secretory pathway pseudopilin PulG